MMRLTVICAGCLVLALVVVGALDAYTATHLSDSSLAGLVDHRGRVETLR